MGDLLGNNLRQQRLTRLC